MACGDALESGLFLRGLLVSFLKGRIVPEEECGSVMPLHLFTDCRSLYDHLHREGVPKPPSEKRLATSLQPSDRRWRLKHAIYGEQFMAQEK